MQDSSSKGFSFLEILVVLAIVALITCWAIPAWRSLYHTWQQRRAIRVAYQGLQWARLQAVQHQTNCFFCLTKGDKRCVKHQAAGYVVMCQNKQKRLQVMEVGRFSHAMRWHWQGLAANHLGFNAWGGSTANGRLGLASTDGVKTILISHTGRVRLSD